MSPMNIPGWEGADLTGGPIYKSFIFFTIAYFGYLPRREASKIGKLYMNKSYITNIAHTHHQIHNIVYDNQKQNKFDNFKTI
jgi:hypothetical protein